jgi:GTP-binding protein
MVRVDEQTEFVLADLPGLIEGAASGVGLGYRFLRHAERCRVLVQVLDMSSLSEGGPIHDFSMIQEELRLYKADLGTRKQIVAANKMDMPGAEEQLQELRASLGSDYEIYPISALNGAGLTELLWGLAQLLREAPPPCPEAEDEIRRTVIRAEQPFAIERGENGLWLVRGARVEKLVAMTNLDNNEAVLRLQRIFIGMGLEEALSAAGVQAGDTVEIAGRQFEYAE